MPIPSRLSSDTAVTMPAPCADTRTGHSTQVLAMAYVELQSFGALYDPCTALIAGTLFSDLDKPFCGETVSASAYPVPPARTCSCTLSARRNGCGCERGGAVRG